MWRISTHTAATTIPWNFMTLLQDVPSASLKSPSVWVLLSLMKYTIFHPLFPSGVRMQSVDGVVHWRYAYLNTPYFVFVLTTQYTFAGDECSKRPVLVYSQWDNKYSFSMNGCVCTRFVLHRSIFASSSSPLPCVVRHRCHCHELV